jgi:endonuclease-3
MGIGALLDQYIPHPEIPLQHRDPYTLLIAVLLSAQCTDARVNQVTPALFARADTPEKMSQLEEEEIARLIRSCGLYRTKARAIRALSQILVEKYGGVVPRQLEALEALPGVGHKTASVVLVQAFHIPAFPVDTHIYRCARRWGLSRGKSVAPVERDLKRHFPPEEWGRRHLQIILFARQYCPAKGHDPQRCPLCSLVSRN